ncbi:GNAT family N-acetyltransferase [Pseudoflavonifractor phocaeensis]|uniref:GNAT family N-acetyltransferase n=1 Tax=Pseudoflavonifractor phocaeensis TaxID=1870988 RepID=UPI001F160A01|nr:GNAT family N-acetyltransferase [Pseudoflavonifractor phocaeensis]MCF2661165.1 GNAT family N-acetyltransferase [Pseudoflavonifractor phocaeensis]
MDKETFAEYAVKNTIEDTLQEALDILDADDGKSFEEKREAIIEHLQKHREPVLVDALADLAIADKIGQQNKDEFWRYGEITCPGTSLILRKTDDTDRSGYIALQKEYCIMKSMLAEDAYCDMVWNEHVEPKALMLTIVQDGSYIGYCGIKNTTQTTWEIAVELLPQWTRQGIGYCAITAMMEAIAKRLGVNEFRVRIDPGNKASQKLFEKLGAQPNGISEFLIHDQDSLKKVEEDNLHLIDEDTITLAAKFGVEPRALLSHVLEYTLIYRQ